MVVWVCGMWASAFVAVGSKGGRWGMWWWGGACGGGVGNGYNTEQRVA